MSGSLGGPAISGGNALENIKNSYSPCTVDEEGGNDDVEDTDDEHNGQGDVHN